MMETVGLSRKRISLDQSLKQFNALLATEAIIAFTRQRVEFVEYSNATDYEPAFVASYLTVMRQDTQQRA
ncbi:MAG: hypothetical protein IT444_14175 [Phycisphaeraceae bacterium]|nr:hypothetical protein [Phycisphaeraceae bacterium]